MPLTYVGNLKGSKFITLDAEFELLVGYSVDMRRWMGIAIRSTCEWSRQKWKGMSRSYELDRKNEVRKEV